MSRVAIYARVHETGLPVAWSAAANMLKIIGLVALSISDAEAIERLLIARFHPDTHENRRAHIFFSFVEHRRCDNHHRNSRKFRSCKWKFITEYILACPLLVLDILVFRPSSPLDLHFPLCSSS